jgi:hypothetical protein
MTDLVYKIFEKLPIKRELSDLLGLVKNRFWRNSIGRSRVPFGASEYLHIDERYNAAGHP